MTISRFGRVVLLAGLVLIVTASFAAAAEPFAFSLGGFLNSLNNQTRIVQFCVGAMCLGLFILMKKFVDGEASFQSRSRERPADLQAGDRPAASLESATTKTR